MCTAAITSAPRQSPTILNFPLIERIAFRDQNLKCSTGIINSICIADAVSHERDEIGSKRYRYVKLQVLIIVADSTQQY